MEDKREDMAQDEQEQKRESGMPGGGQGRRDEVGSSHVYPVSSGEMPPGDELIRTPGEFGQRGRGLDGYYDHGTSETVTMPPGDQDSTQNSASGQTGSTTQKIDPTETAASGMVDVDQDRAEPPERY